MQCDLQVTFTDADSSQLHRVLFSMIMTGLMASGYLPE